MGRGGVSPKTAHRIGVVLAGGGARGAYEVGVLSYLFEDLARKVGRPVPLDVVCGTSVGAVNGAFLAGVVDAPERGLARLRALWNDLELSHVLGFGFRQATGLHRVLLGGSRGGGIFDAGALGEIVRKSLPWRSLANNLRSGRLRALTITTTHVASGRPVVFVHLAPGAELPTDLPPRVVVQGDHILPPHVLASASIPLLFPPVRIRADLHCDGGLRLNTPMAPAIQLGCTRLLVVGMASANSGTATLSPGRYPGATFLLGKVLNAFLLDHVSHDIDELNEINQILAHGEAAFGAGFVERISEVAVAEGRTPRRIVEPLVLRPSVDIGLIAADHLVRHRARFGATLGRGLLRTLALGEGADADLASYLLFDGPFAQRLIDLGRSDAEARRDALEAFFYGTK